MLADHCSKWQSEKEVFVVAGRQVCRSMWLYLHTDIKTRWDSKKEIGPNMTHVSFLSTAAVQSCNVRNVANHWEKRLKPGRWALPVHFLEIDLKHPLRMIYTAATATATATAATSNAPTAIAATTITARTTRRRRRRRRARRIQQGKPSVPDLACILFLLISDVFSSS